MAKAQDRGREREEEREGGRQGRGRVEFTLRAKFKGKIASPGIGRLEIKLPLILTVLKAIHNQCDRVRGGREGRIIPGWGTGHILKCMSACMCRKCFSTSYIKYYPTE